MIDTSIYYILSLILTDKNINYIMGEYRYVQNVIEIKSFNIKFPTFTDRLIEYIPLMILTDSYILRKYHVLNLIEKELIVFAF